jgi:hypothetical protein
MIIRDNLDYDRACKVAGTHPVKIAPNLYLCAGAAKKKNAPDEPDQETDTFHPLRVGLGRWRT